MHLTQAEIVDLTHYKVAKKQAQALHAMGFTFVLRPDGSVAVLRAHVEKLMGLCDSKKREQEATVNLEWMNG